MTMRHQASARDTIFRPRHSASSSRHVWQRFLLGTIAAAAGFSIVLVQTTVAQINDSFTVGDISKLVPVAPPEGPVDPDDPLAGRDVNILIMGSDIRDGENRGLGGFVEGMRADATVIMHISADRSRVELVSIPRDLRVTIPNCELFDGTVVRGWTAKFNVAFANGGIQGDPVEAAACAVNTVSQMTGLTFDHYMVMDFAGFRNMVDALDGVPMCIPEPIYSDKAKLELEAGPQVLDGTTALAFARARTGTNLGDGSDLNRIDRQQELLENLMRKALGMNLVSDTPALTQFVRAVAESITMDPKLADTNYIAGLAFSLRNIDTENIVFETVPWGSPGDGSGDIVMTWEAAPMFAKLVADEPIREPEVDSSPSTDTGNNGTSATSTSANSTSEAGSNAAVPVSSSTPDTPKRETEEEILDACEAPAA